MKKRRIGLLELRTGLAAMFLVISSGISFAQNAYFIDGYHGGIYGHYPDHYTQFLVDMFNRNPYWKISLEIEPETWDSVKMKDTDAYRAFRDLVLSPGSKDRIEFTNPSYGQGYLYNISGESIIRQFTYGIHKLNEHFPGVSFNTYAVEEPCFTGCLPQILKSLGFKYAVLRCPNTCWGGYPRAFGGELVNWTGPDGTKLVTVPRYACEGFQENSVWQTQSWNNSEEFIHKCFSMGIQHPAGMTYQDAGWRGGPWLGNAVKEYYKPSIYETWTNYIENISTGKPDRDWKFSQEDLQVSLVWGSQILQKLAQRIRVSENKIIAAEKIASVAGIYQGFPWPKSSFDEAWRTLLLSEHHDCWIVPYNGSRGNTWADKVAIWTGTTNQKSDTIIQQSFRVLCQGNATSDQYIRVFNTTGCKRSEFASVSLPEGWGAKAKVLDNGNKEVVSQIITNHRSNVKELIFKADVPSLGYNTYKVQKARSSVKRGASVSGLADGTYKIETDLYTIIMDPAKGGSIMSLVAKTLGNKEFVDLSGTIGFNSLRGNFFNAGGFCSSTENHATVTILENGPALVRVETKGTIASHPFTQVITVAQGKRRIDIDLRIDWKGNPGIGNEYSQSVKWEQTDRKKAFYNNRDKLLVLFPLKLPSQKVYVNAPFDVTESSYDNTFFTRWDSIKNDIVLNWVDITDATNNYGMALLTDHTTSYAHGSDYPPGLTIQYSGIGLWGRNYNISGPTEVSYSLIPHAGKWDQSGIWTEGTYRNEPLLATMMVLKPATGDIARSLIDVTGTGLEISSATYEGGELLVRLFNAEGDNGLKKLSFDGKAERVELVELNGEKAGNVKMNRAKNGRTTLEISIPRFGIRTLKFFNLIPSM